MWGMWCGRFGSGRDFEESEQVSDCYETPDWTKIVGDATSELRLLGWQMTTTAFMRTDQ
jgi:hypothetical protein